MSSSLDFVTGEQQAWHPLSRDAFHQLRRGDRLADRHSRVWMVCAEPHEADGISHGRPGAPGERELGGRLPTAADRRHILIERDADRRAVCARTQLKSKSGGIRRRVIASASRRAA